MSGTIHIIEAEGQIINHALFTKDVYKDKKGRESEPKYRVEIAYDDENALDELYDIMVAAVKDEYGKVDEDDIKFPIIDGDVLAKKREKNEKDGSAYEGRDVIRATTKFNKHGEDDVGGVAVYKYDDDGDVVPVAMQDKGDIHRGVWGQLKVETNVYEDEKTGNPCVSLYLKSFCMTREPTEDEKIGGGDDAEAFKKVGRKGGGKRKSRKG